ncbi:hypothetical protein LTR10_009984 [Elasticomyces elasticus]|nr:hypothetical protein LTR10_009984 [Elasticomyces elasticus]KAK4970276.1 hypothetical protein LTR42_008443 [Elasticomyces elasticus]
MRRPVQSQTLHRYGTRNAPEEKDGKKEDTRQKTASRRETERHKRWTAEEDMRMMRMRELKKSWYEIRQAMPHRTFNSLANRARRLSPPSPERSDYWSAEEMATLMKLKAQNQPWLKIQKGLPRHTLVACQWRWAVARRTDQDQPREQERSRPWTPAELERLRHLKQDLNNKHYAEFQTGLQGRRLWSKDEIVRLEKIGSEGEGLAHWANAASQFPGRAIKTLRNKWCVIREPGRKDSKWSSEECAKLVNLREQADSQSWQAIRDEAFPNRTANALQRKYGRLSREKPPSAS